MIPLTILEKMKMQAGSVIRPDYQLKDVMRGLVSLGIDQDTQFASFFFKFRLAGVLSRQNIELLDLCSPTYQIEQATDFAQNIYEMPSELVCLTSGEGEGFVVYCKKDSKIYDIGVDEIDYIVSGDVVARWDSFYELVDWYLS